MHSLKGESTTRSTFHEYGFTKKYNQNKIHHSMNKGEESLNQKN